MRATASEAAGSGARARAGLALAVLAAGLLLAASGVLRPLDWKVFDLFTALAPASRTAVPVVILAIDEPTFQELRRPWPFPRRLHGALLERVRADGALAVGFDVVFADPGDPADDAAFAAAIRRAGGVVLAAARERLDDARSSLWTEVRPLPALLAAGAQAGDIGVQPEADYVVRRQPAGADSLAARLAALAGAPGLRPGATLLEYLGPRGTIDTRSYYQALEPGLLPPGFFRGKLVLVGHATRTAVELGAGGIDTFNSPFTFEAGADRQMPGVEIQATLVANRLAGGGIRPLDAGWALAWAAALAALLLAAAGRLHPLGTAALTGGLALATLAGSFALFAATRQWLSPLLPLAVLAVLHAATTVADFLATRQRARRVRGMFAHYVPPAVVERLVARPELLRLGGETREVTLMFTDLAGFTALAERLSAPQAVELLTAYFDAMAPIVHRWHGTLDKFIGDALMAFWGAPLDDARHAEHALRAALEMQQAMEPLAQHLRARGLPPIAMRIGLHSGPAVVGNVGAASRFSYTAIGDTVNLAARLEGENKTFGSAILLSAATAGRLPADLQRQLRPLDDVVVKGRSEPVRVFTPCADEALRAASSRALQALDAGRDEEARAAAREVLALHPGDAAAARWLQRGAHRPHAPGRA